MNSVMRYRFALQLYSVSDDLAKDLTGTLKAVKEMGYEAVEFAGRYTHTAEQVAEALAEAGLICCGWHTPYDYLQDDKLDATIAYNRKIGNECIIVPGIRGEETGTPAAWRKVAARFNVLADRLSKCGMRIGYHTHDTDFIPMEGEIPFDILFGNTIAGVIAQIDTGNSLQGGADICGLVRRYPGRERSVHLKPYSLANGFETMIGEDDVPWSGFMQACRTIGGTQWYIVEYESEALPAMDGVKRCLEELRKMQDSGII